MEQVGKEFFEVIVAEVLRRLQARQVSQRPRKKAVVLFTGGLLGVGEALNQLGQIQSAGWELELLFSPSGQRVVSVERVLEKLGSAQVLNGNNDIQPYQLVKDTDLVLVPVLTQNTAAKVALGIADTNVTSVLSQAIMQGKPVVAVGDAADPNSPKRQEMGLDKAPNPWKRMLTDHLATLQSFGIRLVQAQHLAQTVTGQYSGEKQPVALAVVTRADILAARDQGGRLVVARGAIVTPLAREVAEEQGVQLLLED